MSAFCMNKVCIVHDFLPRFCENYFIKYAEAYSELCQASKMKRFAKIVNGLKPLTISQNTPS